MTRCFVPKCSEIGVHHFPRDKKIRRLWLKAIRGDKSTPTNSSRLCRKHFVESDYENISKYTGVKHKYLKKDAVPSIFSWNMKPVSKEAKSREQRLQTRNLKKQLFSLPYTSQHCEDIVPLEEDSTVHLDSNVFTSFPIQLEYKYYFLKRSS